jgi:hypothetical protein
MSPHATVQQYPRFLLEYEKSEIFQYSTIYYINMTREKLQIDEKN